MILASATSPSLLAGLSAAVVYALLALLGGRLPQHHVHRLVLGGWVLHGLSVSASLVSGGDGLVRFGFAPALSATAWLMLLFYLLERQWYPLLRTRWTLASLGVVTVLLPLVFPGQALHTSASVWLPLHWALGLASYGLFAAAVVHAWLMVRTETQIRLASEPQAGVPLLTLERLTFRFVFAGFVLLTATLLAGWWFGDVLYGPDKAWRWDHKTIFSVLAWATFAGLLLARRQLGWRGRKAARVLYIGTGLLLLAYVGSRFVLEVILGRAA
jgi:ABC-type uncharacterized transport system permease subunit